MWFIDCSCTSVTSEQHFHGTLFSPLQSLHKNYATVKIFFYMVVDMTFNLVCRSNLLKNWVVKIPHTFLMIKGSADRIMWHNVWEHKGDSVVLANQVWPIKPLPTKIFAKLETVTKVNSKIQEESGTTLHYKDKYFFPPHFIKGVGFIHLKL